MTTRKNLLSKIFFCLSLSAATLAVATSASAQSPVRVSVPFSFTADNVTFPAGSYSISPNLQIPSVINIRNVQTGATKMLMVRSDSGDTNTRGTRLTFTRQAGGIYLSQVWTRGTSTHTEFISHPKADQEMARLSPRLSVGHSTFDIASE